MLVISDLPLYVSHKQCLPCCFFFLPLYLFPQLVYRRAGVTHVDTRKLNLYFCLRCNYWSIFRMMDNISLLSINCQGLGNFQKRRDIMHFWKQKKYDILLLQDTHFEKKMEKYITAEWGYQAIFASNNSLSRGVAILFNNTFEFKIKNIIRDDKCGNYIFALLKLKEVDYLIINIYGPNRDNPDF